MLDYQARDETSNDYKSKLKFHSSFTILATVINSITERWNPSYGIYGTWIDWIYYPNMRKNLIFYETLILFVVHMSPLKKIL